LHPVEIEKRNTIAPLFEGIQDSMVIACLQGIMGEAYVARKTEPKAAMIVSGEYSFFGGDPTSPDARELVQNLFRVNESDRTVVIFNDQLLQRYMDAIPEGYQLAPFDEDLYHQAMAEDWSREFCEVFPSAEEYLNKGFGFGILKEGRLVSGASTMTVYHGGIEIQVATRESYGGKGLAMACSAALIRECVRRGIRPCWDAANLTSKHMALNLGYEYRGEYLTIQMSREELGE
jgi:GNAT superfamily N-acetyltransferase